MNKKTVNALSAIAILATTPGVISSIYNTAKESSRTVSNDMPLQASAGRYAAREALYQLSQPRFYN